MTNLGELPINPRWRVRTVRDVLVRSPTFGTRVIPAGVRGTIYPFSTRSPTVSVVFDAPYAPRYGPNSLLVSAADIEVQE